jgi:hypothetical protein
LQDPIWKNTQHKNRAGGVSQVIECLPSMHEALSLNPCAKKKFGAGDMAQVVECLLANRTEFKPQYHSKKKSLGESG